MSKITWRRWRPHGAPVHLDLPINSRSVETDPFVLVHQRLKQQPLGRTRWKRSHDFQILNQLIDNAKSVATKTNTAVDWLYALSLQAPRAAVAQKIMDEHPHGYHNKEARLFELIDFNDAFVASILVLEKNVLPRAVLEIKNLAEQSCKKAGTRCFSDEQFQAIAHGLSREIAVYLGLQREGYEVEMTNRVSDAFGIDMHVTDPKTLQKINIDIKTRSAYRYRIEQLRREGRLSDETLLMAERNGFAVVFNGHGSERTKVVIWCIDHELLGPIVNFSFENTELLAAQLRHIMLAAR